MWPNHNVVAPPFGFLPNNQTLKDLPPLSSYDPMHVARGETLPSAPVLVRFAEAPWPVSVMPAIGNAQYAGVGGLQHGAPLTVPPPPIGYVIGEYCAASPQLVQQHHQRLVCALPTGFDPPQTGHMIMQVSCGTLPPAMPAEPDVMLIGATPVSWPTLYFDDKQETCKQFITAPELTEMGQGLPEYGELSEEKQIRGLISDRMPISNAIEYVGNLFKNFFYQFRKAILYLLIINANTGHAVISKLS